MLDVTVYGRQEAWEDSREGWPQRFFNTTSAQMRTDDNGLFLLCAGIAGRSKCST
jgi:hypothetical protein